MAIDWQKLPERGSALPFNGDQVLLAVPNRLASGRTDPDFPYELHLARWDDDEGMWATNETDDETDGILWLAAAAPTFWAEIDLPY
ncbi:hypothetical protein HNO88_002931 [Novosphingobium chloroacetimidivorans]|uniref:Uncharacterized protein n=1 Tax=Novosphingobium chloroacetimidivorans TaxID=1428314 RepID=A0A7W7KB68_9SPHN|nr:hypothetical protein [Novosphingobium chloroacetimidivorans]MBB4859602.1 hypothetical protein [Novosphingobium chloroacetimidivorans]